ncbi:MAG: tetratricopeptide repeat protein [Nitrospirae bacterium]|nr:tetratricopeptide repeat protein [Nitrospirota bacterium]
MLVRLLLAGLLLVTVGCFQTSPEAKRAKHRERGVAYFEKAKYAEALIEYKNVLQIDPKDGDAHYRLALTYMKMGGLTNLQQAFAELSKTVELDAKNSDAQLKLGEMYLLAKEPGKARERADIVLASAPTSSEGLVLRGQSLINEQEFDQGITELKRALELDPKNTRIYLDLARTYMQMKQPVQAEDTLKDAMAISPNAPEIIVALGDLRLFTGKPSEAEAYYLRAIEVAPPPTSSWPTESRKTKSPYWFSGTTTSQSVRRRRPWRATRKRSKPVPRRRQPGTNSLTIISTWAQWTKPRN